MPSVLLTPCHIESIDFLGQRVTKHNLPMPETKQLNVRIEPEHEALARQTIERLRRGGAAFREALIALLRDDAAAVYLPAREIRSRFDNLEARIARLEKSQEPKD